MEMLINKRYTGGSVCTRDSYLNKNLSIQFSAAIEIDVQFDVITEE